MAIVEMELDPNAAVYADLADLDATAASKLAGIADGAEANPADLAELDATAATKLGKAIITDPQATEFTVVSIQRKANGNLGTKYDDVAV